VYDTTALFVVDEYGVIRWRYVLGVDAAPRSSVAGATVETSTESIDSPGTLRLSRRDFVQAALAAGAVLALTVAPRTLRAADGVSTSPDTVSGATSITLNVNGHPLALDVEPRVTLLDALRERAGLTGTKKGCDHGQCGACTVHIDGRRVLSCMTLAVMVPANARVTTIEGLATGDTLHPMQQAFITHDGFQCGYCTSGQIMSAAAMVNEPWGAGDADVREAMSGNICRCGAYPGIVAAVQSVRGRKQEASR
jgi:xanthine dehydrogenase YagT iron-sulfur-binding subunit